MKKTVAAQVASVATHPVSTSAWIFGLLRGFSAEAIRIASGQRGPLMPGDLREPEQYEAFDPEDTTRQS